MTNFDSLTTEQVDTLQDGWESEIIDRLMFQPEANIGVCGKTGYWDFWNKLRLSVHRCARAVSSEACGRLGLDITPAAADVIAELVYKKLRIYGADLEAFAKHAKRNTVNAEDVKLLVRRNPSLKAHITSLADSSTHAPKRRKTAGLPPPLPVFIQVPSTASAAPSAPAAPASNEPSTSRLPDESMDFHTTIDLTF